MVDRCRCCRRWLAPSSRFGPYCEACVGVLLLELTANTDLVVASVLYDAKLWTAAALAGGPVPFDAGERDG